jgi:hypothetical protein
VSEVTEARVMADILKRSVLNIMKKYLYKDLFAKYLQFVKACHSSSGQLYGKRENVMFNEICRVAVFGFSHIVSVSVTEDGFSFVTGFINHPQVVTTYNYNTVTDFHTTKHSMLLSSVYLH